MAVLLALFLVFSEYESCADVPTISVRHSLGTGHPVHQGLERFRESLAGVVSVEITTPRNERESLQGLITGTVDAAVVSPASLQAMVRELAMLDLIGMWRDYAHWSRALDGTAGRELAALLERGNKAGDKGLRLLGYWGGTRRHLLTRRKRVETIEDLSALRLGIPLNPVRSKMWKSLGVQPVLPTHTDTLASLRDNAIDGVDEEPEAILQARLYEAASHLTETGHVIGTRLFLISKLAWEKLNRTQREALTTASQAATGTARKSEVSRENDALAALKERFSVNLHAFKAHDELRLRTLVFRGRYADELNAARIFKLIENAATP